MNIYLEKRVKILETRFGKGRFDFSNTTWGGKASPLKFVCNTCRSVCSMFPVQANTISDPCKTCREISKTEKARAVFIEKSKKIHQEKYKYNKVKYRNSKQKVDILCNTHGSFLQTPNDHIQGHGCPECAYGDSRGSTEEFIKLSNGKYGNKYSYEKTKYSNSFTKVTITCKEHGDFFQIPANHLRAEGCKECAELPRRLSLKDFVDKGTKVHKGKYLYDRTIYTKSRDKVEIGCPEHGHFWQIASNHLSGTGCPSCPVPDAPTHVYLLKVLYNNTRNLYKIGVTRNIEVRVRRLNNNIQGVEFCLEGIITTKPTKAAALELETELHKQHTKYPIGGDFEGFSEIFRLTKEEVHKLMNRS